MKTKLLRKIRKRYEINYYPNGYDFGSGYETDMECVALIDTKFWTFKHQPVIQRLLVVKWINKEEAYKECLHTLKQTIIDEYGTRRNKKLKKKEEKLWHVIK